MIGKNTFYSPLVVLLTSSIKPKGANPAKIQERRRQYEEALRAWMLHPDPRISGIVYCDNTTPDLVWTYELADHYNHTKPFEAIYCPDNNIPIGMHYGYPELGIIDHSIYNSRLLIQSTYFAKITGRLQFPKFASLLDRLPASYDACIDYRLAYRRERKSWSNYRARTQLMFFKNDFYKKSLSNKRLLMVENNISHIEEFIAGILVPDDVKSANIIFRWPIECPPSGVAGNGENYNSGRKFVKSYISHCSRRLLPWLWI